MKELFMKYFWGLVFIFCLNSNASAQEFEQGQAWSYNTRDHEQDSILQISKIDDGLNGDRIISITLLNLKMKIINYAQPYMENLPHIPISEKTLKGNVKQQVKTEALPLISYDGYDNWKSAFDSGEAGYWTIDIKEIISVIEQSINQNIEEIEKNMPNP